MTIDEYYLREILFRVDNNEKFEININDELVKKMDLKTPLIF